MIYCKHCGESFDVHLFLAMMIELGCKTSDPNYCYASEDHKHEYVREGDGELHGPDPDEL